MRVSNPQKTFTPSSKFQSFALFFRLCKSFNRIKQWISVLQMVDVTKRIVTRTTPTGLLADLESIATGVGVGSTTTYRW
jgi:hypothetical protein